MARPKIQGEIALGIRLGMAHMAGVVILWGVTTILPDHLQVVGVGVGTRIAQGVLAVMVTQKSGILYKWQLL